MGGKKKKNDKRTANATKLTMRPIFLGHDKKKEKGKKGGQRRGKSHALFDQYFGLYTLKKMRNSINSFSPLRKTFHQGFSSSRLLMRFLMISKDEKKMALTAQDRIMETPRPRYM